MVSQRNYLGPSANYRRRGIHTNDTGRLQRWSLINILYPEIIHTGSRYGVLLPQHLASNGRGGALTRSVGRKLLARKEGR